MNEQQIFSLTGTLLAIIVICIVVIVFQTNDLMKMKKQIRELFPIAPSLGSSSSIGHIVLLLESMKGELTDGDYRILIDQANALSIVKANGELSYVRNLNKVLFTPKPSNIVHIYGK